MFGYLSQGAKSVALATKYKAWTSKSGRETRFAPKWRKILQPLNFQKYSEAVVFWPFSLPNVLLVTAALVFSTSEFPKLL